MMAHTAGCLQEIGEVTDSVLSSMNLRTFLLRLPLPTKDAGSTIQGICEKVMKNRSSSHTKSNPLDSNTEQPDISRAEAYVQRIREMLSSESVAGFVLVVVENPSTEASEGSEVHYCPVAGGIVEVLDSFERSVRAIWCRRSLPSDVSEAIMRALALRLFAYGFASSQQVVPNLLNKESLSPAKAPAANRLISCTQESMFLFPRDATAFMKTQLCMSKHWETPLDGGSHIDHPKAPSVRNVAGAWQFSGISLSRFVNYWRNHGRTAVPDISNTAKSYFAANARLGQEKSPANGVKRQRRSSDEPSASNHESGSPRDSGHSESPVKDEHSTESSKPSDVIASSRRELRAERSSHVGEPQGQADSTTDNAMGKRSRRDAQRSGMHATAKPASWRKRGRLLASKKSPRFGSDERGLKRTRKLATNGGRQLRGKLRAPTF
ncbi:hypothetical protein Emed_003420 [Eimeria media]